MKSLAFLFVCMAALGEVVAQPGMGVLKIEPLTGNYFVFSTWKSFKGTPVSANGMYLVTGSGVVMFDTPWDTSQFQPLLDSIGVRHNKRVIACIATHSHEDRTGGFAYYRALGIPTFATAQTDSICFKRGEKRAEFLLGSDTTFAIGGYVFQTFYPGPAHAPDNIVLWFPKEKILYGGCLVKSTEATDLGFTGDANVPEWPNAVKRIQQKFGKPAYIITGHQGWRSTKSLEHTLKLLKLAEGK
jgi:metallo-beta-lactamase class B